ncbi:hypothetical protein IF2G_07199 [Cordyceps javanica]|nr:hypothetical protein IF2G_07199 [Cordyceps javanica]
MTPGAKKKYCAGSEGFDPSTVAGDATLQSQIDELLKEDDLLSASRALFKLPNDDDYVYHATASIISEGRDIADMGSGNGYWSYMLRAYGLKSHAVDNLQSAWRVSWVDDTVISDGVKWLEHHGRGEQMVLLLVYPVVGGGSRGGSQGVFTKDLVDTYGGDTIAVVGTQNKNGYTGFKDLTMAEYMEKEQPSWTKIVQISLPSFAGKDEALFVFQRGERALKLEEKPS